ncbi:hypothetical protein D3C72_126670 [compost metagenome]
MRRSAIFACLIAFTVLTSCAPAPNVPVSPDPSPGQGGNPFPRLANPQPGEPLEVAEYFQDASTGIKVSQFLIHGGTDTDGDGTRDYLIQAQVDLGDKGVHDVEMVEEDAPSGSDKPNIYSVKDRTDMSRFVFELDADGKQARIWLEDAVLKVAVAGDEQVSLDDAAPLALEPAAQQALERMLQGKVSPHGVALLYAKLLRSPIDGAQGNLTQSGATAEIMNRHLFEQYLYQIFKKLYPGYVPGTMQSVVPEVRLRLG